MTRARRVIFVRHGETAGQSSIDVLAPRAGGWHAVVVNEVGHLNEVSAGTEAHPTPGNEVSAGTAAHPNLGGSHAAPDGTTTGTRPNGGGES